MKFFQWIHTLSLVLLTLAPSDLLAATASSSAPDTYTTLHQELIGPGLSEKTEKTRWMLATLTPEELGAENHEKIKAALRQYEAGDAVAGDILLFDVIGNQTDTIFNNQSTVGFSRDQKIASLLFLTAQRPEQIQTSVTQTLQSVQKGFEALLEIRKKYSGFIDRLDFFRSDKKAALLFQLTLQQLEAKLAHSQNGAVLAFFGDSAGMSERIQKIFNAFLNHYPSTLERVEEFSQYSHSLLQTGKWPKETGFQPRLREKEFHYDTLNVIFNKQTITAAGLTAALVGEFLLLPFFEGAIPPTVIAVASAVKVVGTTIIIGRSTLNILDRLSQNGISGLVNLETALDLLVILTLAPRSAPRMFSAGALAGRAGWVTKAWAQTQYQAGYALLAGQTSYGVWQITRAEAIAREFHGQNIDISAGQIRKQGYVNIAFGLIGGAAGYMRYRAAASKAGSNYSTIIQEARYGTRLKANLELMKTQLNPWHALLKIKGGIQGVLAKNFRTGATSIFKGGLQLTYDAMMAQTLVLLPFTYADYNFMSKVQIPDVKSGEIAVVANGFDPTDLLYYATTTDISNTQELTKYVRGKNLFFIDFDTPHTLFKKLAALSIKHGKIKYLKIATHGMPGHMLTRTHDLEGDFRGDYADDLTFIDIAFLKGNRNSLQTFAFNSMAENSEVVLASCLVGANLDEPMEIHDRPIHQKIGDEFIHLLGDILLVRGGTIDSSRRMIGAMKGMYGSAATLALFSGMETEKSRSFFAEAKKIQDDVNDSNAYATRLEKLYLHSIPATQADQELYKNIIQEMASRIVQTHLKMYQMVYKYGINIEGGFFAEKHRKDVFLPHPLQP